MSDVPHHKSKTKLVETITNDEDDIRFRIWSGEIPLWEAAKARFDYLMGRTDVYRTISNMAHNNLEIYLRDYRILNKALRREVESLKGSVHSWCKAYQHMRDINFEQELRYTKRIENYWNSIVRLKEEMNSLKKRLVMSGNDCSRLFSAQDKMAREIEMLLSQTTKEETVDNVIDLKEHIAKKGNDSGVDDSINWLWPMAPGTLFLAKPKRQDFRMPGNPVLQSFYVEAHIEGSTGIKAVKLLADLNEPAVHIWADSDEYCRQNILAGVLHDPNKE